jgi:DNA-binding cell septation regulator SpoVG
MFSYDVKVRKINSTSNLKAFVTLVIEGLIEVDGFKIIDGKNGLFVSAPSHKGTVMEEGVKVEKYFDDVRFLGEKGTEFGNEIKASILNAYNSNASQSNSIPSQAQAVKAKVTANTVQSSSKDSEPARTRKPLWGF